MAAEGFELRDRLAYLEIDAQVRRLLPQAWQVIRPHLQSILEDFYKHMLARPWLARIIQDPARVPTLIKAQTDHWERLFRGTFDDDYMDHAYRIGAAHQRIGLRPSWYSGAYSFILVRLRTVIGREYRMRPWMIAPMLDAVGRAVFLDMDIAISTYRDIELKERATRANTLEALVGSFENRALDTVGNVLSGLDGIQGAATSMGEQGTAESRRTLDVAEAAERSRTNVATVAATTEELAASAREIGSQVTQSSLLVDRAVTQAGSSNDRVQSLATAVGEISHVVSLIDTIASQTNLLALNATIEAARAGEAGKGFAVVASEVKALANQTQKATEEIAAQIQSVQAATKEAAAMIETVVSTINEVAEIVVGVSSAVDEQQAATSEIARSANSVREDAGMVTDSVTTLARASARSYAASIRILWACREMQTPVETLRKDVDSFVTDVKSA